MAMGHVVLKEFFVDRRVPFFVDYVQRYTDLPFLVTLEEQDGAHVPGKFLTAADLGDDTEGAAWRRCCSTGVPASRSCRTGRSGSATPRRAWAGGTSTSDGVAAQLTVLGGEDGEAAEVLLPRFDAFDGRAASCAAACRCAGWPGRLVTTVFDLLLAQYGVRRAGLPGTWPSGYDDADEPYTPGLAGADHFCARRPRWCGSRGRWPTTPRSPSGRTMIIMGAGISQWFHGDATYRAVLALPTLTGSRAATAAAGRTTSGQEKCRPVTGWATHGDGDRLAAAAAADDRHGVLVHCTPTSGATTATAPTRSPRRSPGARSPASTRST